MISVNMVRIFKALACEKRLAIVKLLLEKKLCVGRIASNLDASQSSISQHLRVLRDAGIVQDNRCGYHIHYTVKRELLEQMGEEISTMLKSDDKGAVCPEKEKLCAEKTNAASSLTN